MSAGVSRMVTPQSFIFAMFSGLKIRSQLLAMSALPPKRSFSMSTL